MKGANLMHPRLFGGLHDILGDPDGDELLMPGARAYNRGQYDEALGFFTRCVEAYPAAEELLWTHIGFCERVLAVELDFDDGVREQRSQRPGRRLLRRLSRASMPDVRCKWCGHYTPYADPDAGDGHPDDNACERCSWSFPAPDFLWDSVDGLAYSYYRGSMMDEGFYDWFEDAFDLENKTQARQS